MLRNWKPLMASAAILGGMLVAPAGWSAEPAGDLHGLPFCSTCHGVNGISKSDEIPNLAGQHRNYILNQIKSFRDRSRADPHARDTMWNIASAIDAKTAETVAAHYSAQAPAPGVAGDAAAIARGKLLYMQGKPSNDVAQCQRCHGENADGSDVLPRLAGQHAAYIEGQLKAFTSGSRDNDYMHEYAKGLSGDEIRDVAAFLASL